MRRSRRALRSILGGTNRHCALDEQTRRSSVAMKAALVSPGRYTVQLVDWPWLEEARHTPLWLIHIFCTVARSHARIV